MNCKQGDMALVVRSNAGNCGRTVTCLEFMGKGNLLYKGTNGKMAMLTGSKNWWRVDRLMNTRNMDTGVITEDNACFASDESLMPISPPGSMIESKVREEEPV